MSQDIFEVEITHPRNFTVDRKIYGTGGVYPTDESTARQIVESGKGKLVKGKLPKVQDVLSLKSNEDFLNFIRRNAKEILGILSAEADSTTVIEPATNIKSNEAEASSQETESTEGSTDKTEDEAKQTEGTSEQTGTGEQASTLPDDFPGREILVKAGITTIEQIPRDKDKLMKVDQMTGRVANLIEAKLNQ